MSSNNRNSNGGSTGGQSNVNNQKPALTLLARARLSSS